MAGDVRIPDLRFGTGTGGCDGGRGGGGGALAMLRYLGMCHFPGYTFCPKILQQDINFEEKF